MESESLPTIQHGTCHLDVELCAAARTLALNCELLASAKEEALIKSLLARTRVHAAVASCEPFAMTTKSADVFFNFLDSTIERAWMLKNTRLEKEMTRVDDALMLLREHKGEEKGASTSTDFEQVLAELPTVYVRLDIEPLMAELQVWFQKGAMNVADKLDGVLERHCFVCDTVLAVPQFEAALALLLKPAPLALPCDTVSSPLPRSSAVDVAVLAMLKAAAAGNATACGYASLCFFTGWRVDVDISKADQLGRDAAGGGDLRARVLKHLGFGKGDSRSREKWAAALPLATIAARSGDPAAMSLWGTIMTALGETERGAAAQLRAAEAGYAPAQLNVFNEIDTQLARNAAEAHEHHASALHFVFSAARSGYACAMSKIVWLLGLNRPHNTTVRTPRDPMKAFAWANEAASYGESSGLEALGYMYFWGIGVQKNRAHALALARLASDSTFSSNILAARILLSLRECISLGLGQGDWASSRISHQLACADEAEAMVLLNQAVASDVKAVAAAASYMLTTTLVTLSTRARS